MSHDHYFKDVSHLQRLDVYRVVELFEVPAGALDHAAKKILCAGSRGHKDLDRDVQDIIDSLQRWQEMRREDAQVPPEPATPVRAFEIVFSPWLPTAGWALPAGPLEVVLFNGTRHFTDADDKSIFWGPNSGPRQVVAYRGVSYE